MLGVCPAASRQRRLTSWRSLSMAWCQSCSVTSASVDELEVSVYGLVPVLQRHVSVGWRAGGLYLWSRATSFSTLLFFSVERGSSEGFGLQVERVGVLRRDRKRGAGIAQRLERRTRDWKVAVSNPCRSGGRILFCRVNYLCWLLFRYPFHPRVTAVARKHAYTLRVWLSMEWHGAWLYGIHRTRRDGSSFMWYPPCQRCKYTTSVDI